MKTIVITGANSGMGFETAKQLAIEGHHVLLLCRNKAKGEKAIQKILETVPNAKLTLLLADFSSLNSIQTFVTTIKNDYESIDVLINNAGVLMDEHALTEDGLEQMMGVNYFGLVYLTDQLVPLLKNAIEGRIVNVSSITYKGKKLTLEDLDAHAPFKPMTTYGKSKLAAILYTRHLAKELVSTNITVNALHPGAVATSIGVNRETGKINWFLRLFKRFFKSEADGAKTAIYLAKSPEVKRMTGQFFINEKKAKLVGQPLDSHFAELFVNQTRTILKEKTRP